MHQCEQILSYLSAKYPSLTLLEGYEKAIRRFDNKKVVLFQFFQSDKVYVIKYYSIEHLDQEAAQKEKKAIFDEFSLAKAFKGHKGVINVYEHEVFCRDTKEIGVYYTMDYFELTLDKLLGMGQTFSDEAVLSFLKQMDNVLSYAHFQAGVIHSDIKPANIGVKVYNSDVYEYKLMDFDVSVRIQKESSGGQDLSFTITDRIKIRGMTPAYAAPEQVMAQINPDSTITGKADSFAVGVIAVQMLTGRAPASVKESLFYKVPLQQLNSKWYTILSKLCDPRIECRPRRIQDVLPESKTVVADPPLHNHTIKTTPDYQYVPYPSKPDDKSSTVLTHRLAAGFLIILGFILLISVMQKRSSNKVTAPVHYQTREVIEHNRTDQVPIAQPEQEVIEEKPVAPVMITMPSIAGRTLGEARTILRNNGISISNIIYQESSPANKNRVINTRPQPGSTMSSKSADAILVVGKTH